MSVYPRSFLFLDTNFYLRATVKHNFKMFTLTKLFTAALAAASIAIAASTPQHVADGLHRLAQRAKGLDASARAFTIGNAPQLLINQGPFGVCIIASPELYSDVKADNAKEFFAGIKDETKAVKELSQQIQNNPDITDPSDAKVVADAYRKVINRSLGQSCII